MGSLLQDVLGLFAKKKYAPNPYILDKDDYLVLSTKDKSSLNVMAYLPKVEQTLVSTLVLGAAINGAGNTTYDYTSAQNAANVDLILTGSDASIDIVKLVAGTNISLVDNGANNVTINASGGGTGTVTSITTTIDGDAITVNGGTTHTITTTGTFNLQYTGNADQYINGAGILTAINFGTMSSFFLRGQTGVTHTITNGETIVIEGGAKISTVGSVIDTIEIIHDDTTRTDTVSNTTPPHGGTFTVIDTILSDVQGHITDVNTKTVTLPTVPVVNNTTYDLNSVQNGADADIRLVPNVGATDIVKLRAGTNITLTDSGSSILIDSTGSGVVTSLTTVGSSGAATLTGGGVLNIPTPIIPAVPFTSLTTTGTSGLATLVSGVLNIPNYSGGTGTVTSVSAGDGIIITGTATIAPVVNVDYVGLNNIILLAATDVPVAADYFWFSDVSDDTVKKALISDFPGTGGTVTSVGAAAGTGITIAMNSGTNPITGAGEFLITNNGVISLAIGGTANSTGVPLTITNVAGGTSTINPFIYAGTTNIGFVPTGGTASTVLAGDGTWVANPSYSPWIADSDEGTDISVASGATLLFKGLLTAGGAGIETDSAISAGDMTIGLINAGGTPSATTFYRGDGQWITPTGTNLGTVTTVSASTTGDALDVAVTNPTTTPALAFTWAGSNTQYINGSGDLVTFPTIPTGDVTDVLAGPGITVTNGGGPQPTVEVDYLGVDNYIYLRPTATPTVDDWMAFHDITDNNVYKTRFIDFPGYYASWLLAGDSGTETINSGNTVTVAGGTAMTTAVTAPDTVTITLDDTAVTPGTYTNATLTVDQQGRLTLVSNGAGAYTWIAEADTGANITVNSTNIVDFQGGAGMSTSTLGAIVNFDIDYLGVDNCINIRPIVNPTSEDWFLFSDRTDNNVYKRELSQIPGLYNGWVLAADSGVGQVVNSSDQATIAGGLDLSSIVTAPDTVTINHDLFGTAGVYTNLTGITTNSTGHVIATTTSYDPFMTDWTLAGDNGSNQLITNGNTASFLGGLALTTTTSAVDDLVIDHNTFGTPGTYTNPSSVVTNSTGHIISITNGVAPVVYLPMTSTVLGLGKLYSDIVQSVAANVVTETVQRTYGIQFNAAGQLVVNVPWSDTGGVTTVTQGTPGVSTGINTPLTIAPTSGAVIVTSNSYTGGNNVGHVPRGGTIETFLRGDGAWAVTGGGTGMTSFNITADAGISQTIVNADVLNFQGGTGITTTGVVGDIIDFNLNLMTTTARGGAQLGSALTKSIDGQTPEVDLRTYGVHMAAGTEDLAVYVPWTDSNGGSMSQWALTSDSGVGSPSTITNNDNVILTGGPGVNTVGTNSDTVTINLELMTSAIIGGGKLFSDINQSVAANAVSEIATRTYGIQFNSSDQLVVNVPWTDNHGAGYTASNGIILNGTNFEVDYLGLDNIILTAPTLAATENRDYVLVSDASDDNVYKVQLSNLNVPAGIQSVTQTLGSNNTAPLNASIAGTVLSLQNNVFSGSNFVGYVPSSIASDQTRTFLRADGTWQTPGATLSWNIGGNTGADPIVTNDILGIIGSGGPGGVSTAVTTAGNTSTMAVTIVPTGVVVGSYTNSNITVNAQGQIMTITNGTGGGGAVTSISSTDGVDSTGENMTVNTNAVGAVTVDTFAYDGGSNVGYVPDGSGNSDKVWLNGQGNWSSPGAATPTPSSFITDFEFNVRALDMSSGYYGFTNILLGSFFTQSNHNNAVFVDNNAPSGWTDAARFGCTVFGNAKAVEDNCDANAARSFLCGAVLIMTGNQEQTYVVDLYRWDPCNSDSTALVGTASINTIGNGLPVCQPFTLNNANMNFAGSESLFYSVRQTTSGAGSAQARVDLRWTGVAS